MVPTMGCHSTMDSPEWVSRVTPPTTTMANTRAQQTSNQMAMGFCMIKLKVNYKGKLTIANESLVQDFLNRGICKFISHASGVACRAPTLSVSRIRACHAASCPCQDRFQF